MHQLLMIVYYTCLVISTLTGIVRFRSVDRALRLLVILLITLCISEISSYLLLQTKHYQERYILFHISSILELILVTTFFLEHIQPQRKRLLFFISLAFWPLAGTLNILFLQPINTLNTNMLMLESFSIISMSLYTIYDMLKRSTTQNIAASPHFWISVIWLGLWSSTFFFWAFVTILYRNNWAYKDLLLNIHLTIITIVYMGIALILFFYPKMKKSWTPLK